MASEIKHFRTMDAAYRASVSAGGFIYTDGPDCFCLVPADRIADVESWGMTLADVVGWCKAEERRHKRNKAARERRAVMADYGFRRTADGWQ